MRAARGLRPLVVAEMALVAGMLTGCGGGGGTGAATSQAVAPNMGVYPISRIPNTPVASTNAKITGAPLPTAVVGQPYAFQPSVANTAGMVRFTIAHLPRWAKFNTATGQLSGTPDTHHLGKYSGITISLVSGTGIAALPAFSITVMATRSTSSTVALSWQPPTENSDGTALMDLTGYKIHYGSASRNYSDTVQLTNPGLTGYVVQNLPSGKYYFAVSAYNATGKESSLSGEVSTQVD